MSQAFGKVSKYRLRFVGRGMDLLPVETGEVYAADEAWIRLSHAEHAAKESIAAAVRAARADERSRILPAFDNCLGYLESATRLLKDDGQSDEEDIADAEASIAGWKDLIAVVKKRADGGSK